MGNLLSKIESPMDIKALSVDQLKELAAEIRGLIVGIVGRNGGHLASNLGVVDLTLAMHYVFDFKSDKLLWDVGHQCYTHKIITGRKESFSKLRQVDGPSGFPNPAESEYDLFGVGHAGTAIATAIGLAIGQQQTKQPDKIVAVVGDASIVNGLSFEALNNLGLVKRQMLIVLNDNSMAIDSTEGAVAKYFSKIRLSQTYEDLRRTTNNILEHLPVVGKSVEGALERLKKTIRMVFPASQMFESLNIPYFGPCDGHDIESLIELFVAMSHLDRPAILHVYTKKGKGFEPAEQDRSRFHSTGPFEVNGEAIDIEVPAAGRSFTKVFGEHLVELAEKDERIIAITSAMCDGTGLREFRQRFGERFYDVGIAESVAVDIAAGAAKCGLKPVVCIYSTFLQRSFDQIFQEVALQGLGVIFCVDRAGVVGADGPTHHGVLDIGFLRMMPNMVLAAPSDEAEVKLALDFAVGSDRPVVIRYPKDVAVSSGLEATAKPFELGKSVTVRQSANSKIAIVVYGPILSDAVKAAEILSKGGIETDVINARFAAPIDERIVSLLKAGKKLITAEDHGIACGFGSAVMEKAAGVRGAYCDSIRILGFGREFIKHDCRKAQLNQAGLNTDKIVQAVKDLTADN
ncbi:MAG: 1-deoxy-D-xylulose-5-phosphate synthase [Planctomycetota bacterium]